MKSSKLMLAFIGAAFLFGCAAHEKAGDRAAAVGDWKTAVEEYRTAVQGDPSSPQLRTKYQNAKHEAAASSYRHAKACASTGDWDCAVGEADYALKIAEDDAEILAFRKNAAKQLAISRTAKARDAAAARDFTTSYDLLRKAKSEAAEPEVAQAISAALPTIVEGSKAAADALRSQKKYPEAIGLLSSAAEFDPSVSSTLDAVKAEYEKWRAEEYARLTSAGDAALAAKDWTTAAAHYHEASALKPGGRADALATYTNQVLEGERLAGKRDYRGAKREFAAAVGTGQDNTGFAATEAERATVRPYQFNLKEVLIAAASPSGEPWVGPKNPILGTLMKAAITVGATALTGGMATIAGAGIAKNLVDQYESIPPENKPTVGIDISLPDGRTLQTTPKKALYATYAASFVLDSNGFDDRTITFRLLNIGGGKQSAHDIGVIEVPLKDLVMKKTVTLLNKSILGLAVTAGPADSAVDGAFAGLRPKPSPDNLATAFSMPHRGTKGYRLESVKTHVILPDYKDEMGLDGPPDPFVEIIQAGKTVYQSTAVQDQYDASWNPKAVMLFVSADEQLEIRVWDKDASDDDLAIDLSCSAANLESGVCEGSTKAGSTVSLGFEKRHSL